MNRLVTVPFSHFCEKARWALDRAGVPYVEVTQVPVLSWATTLGQGGGRTVPCLFTGGETIKDSTDIVRWADPTLFAPPEATELEDTFDRRLGPAVRRMVYFHMLREAPGPLRELVLGGGGKVQRLVGRAVYPALRMTIVKGLGVDAEGTARSRRVVEEVFAAVDARLADGRRYLCGDAFSAADLAFASLGAAMVLPPQLEPVFPPVERTPGAIRAWVDAHRARPAGELILRLYREDRGRDRVTIRAA